MKKISLLAAIPIITIILTLISSPVSGNITVTTSYYIADAQLNTTFAGGGSHQEGLVPVEASVVVAGNEGTAGAYASADLLTVSSQASVAVLPDPVLANVAVSVAISANALFGVTATNGATNVTAIATVSDTSGYEIYNYNMSVDGYFGGATFGPGTYNLVLTGSSLAVARTEPFGSFKFVKSSVEMIGALNIIPTPTVILLGLIGVGLVG